MVTLVPDAQAATFGGPGRAMTDEVAVANTVLVVEDDGDLRQYLRRVLSDHPSLELMGEAGNGEEALRAFDEQRPGIVVLDLGLPDMAGHDHGGASPDHPSSVGEQRRRHLRGAGGGDQSGFDLVELFLLGPPPPNQQGPGGRHADEEQRGGHHRQGGDHQADQGLVLAAGRPRQQQGRRQHTHPGGQGPHATTHHRGPAGPRTPQPRGHQGRQPEPVHHEGGREGHEPALGGSADLGHVGHHERPHDQDGHRRRGDELQAAAGPTELRGEAEQQVREQGEGADQHATSWGVGRLLGKGPAHGDRRPQDAEGQRSPPCGGVADAHEADQRGRGHQPVEDQLQGPQPVDGRRHQRPGPDSAGLGCPSRALAVGRGLATAGVYGPAAIRSRSTHRDRPCGERVERPCRPLPRHDRVRAHRRSAPWAHRRRSADRRLPSGRS
jgi:hypothetical protein